MKDTIRMLMETIHFMMSHNLSNALIDDLVDELTPFFTELCADSLLSEDALKEFIEEHWNLEND